MKFSDFPIRQEIKIKPIQLNFWNAGPYIIKSIVFTGKDFRGAFWFDFYYRNGAAKCRQFESEKEFELFIEKVEKEG